MDFERRLLRLETENRRLRMGAVVMTGAVMICMLLALSFSSRPVGAQATTLRAQEIILENSQGFMVAQLSVVNGQPNFSMWDASQPSGYPRLQMAVTSTTTNGGGSFLALGNREGVPAHIILRSYEDGRRAFLQVHDPASGRALWTAP